MKTSKQKQAKEKQGYIEEPIPTICKNCNHYRSEHVPIPWNEAFTQEKDMRCGLGGFAVKKTARCNEYIQKNGGKNV